MFSRNEGFPATFNRTQGAGRGRLPLLLEDSATGPLAAEKACRFFPPILLAFPKRRYTRARSSSTSAMTSATFGSRAMRFFLTRKIPQINAKELQNLNI